MKTENEVKFRIKDMSTIKNRLASCGFNFIKKTSQEDYYFSPPHKSFAGTKKYYLRLRNDDGKGKFEYHIVRNDLQTIEQGIAVDNFKVFLNILKALNFNIDCIVKKERLTYQDNNFKVMLDKVKNLGSFIEIEYCGTLTNDIKKKFKNLIILFQLKENQKISGVGYPDLLMRKNYDRC